MNQILFLFLFVLCISVFTRRILRVGNNSPNGYKRIDLSPRTLLVDPLSNRQPVGYNTYLPHPEVVSFLSEKPVPGKDNLYFKKNILVQ